MKCKRRQTAYSNQDIQRVSQPQLKKRARTLCQNRQNLTSLSVNNIRKHPHKQIHEYVKLALKSLNQNFPVLQLKPYSTFYSIQKIEENMNKEKNIFKRSKIKKKHLISEKCGMDQKHKKFSLNTTLFSPKNKVKYKQSKARFNMSMQLNKTTIIPDQQEIMVYDFLKQNKQLNKTHKTAFETFNCKIKQQFPNHFQPSHLHQQSKCKSKSCSQGFFKRKKFKVQQKYEIQQPGYQRPIIQKINSKNKIKQNVSFCVFSRSKNKIICTQKIIPTPQQQFYNTSSLSCLDMNSALKNKFQNQSFVFYKKYMRSSFNNKRRTLMAQMNIKLTE